MAVVVHFDEDNAESALLMTKVIGEKYLMWSMCRHNPVTRDIVGGGGILI